MSSTEEELKACEDELNALVIDLDGKRKEKSATALNGGSTEPVPKFAQRGAKLNPDAKVSDLSWYPLDNSHLVSILQDGKMFIWNARTSQKSYFLWMNTWLMTGDFNQSGTRLAVAGLDNVVTIHAIPDVRGEVADPAPTAEETTKNAKKMEKHGGYIGALKWLDDTTIISGSGDKTIMLWDASKDAGVQKEPENIFVGHGLSGDKEAGDVAALDVHKDSTNTFISGGSDGYCKLWDKRLCNTGNQCAMTFSGHSKTVNSVKFMPSGQQFVTASEDKSHLMFDLRAGTSIHKFEADNRSEASAVAVSSSGRYMFGGYANGTVQVYDLLACDGSKSHGTSLDKYHEQAVTALELSRDGCAVASCSRSNSKNMMIWS